MKRSLYPDRALCLVLALLPLLAAAETAPVLFDRGVVNGADYTEAMAPGTIISLWGSGFSTAVVLNDQIPVRTAMGGVQVEVIPASGPVVLAPLFMVSAGQINAQLPYGLSGAVRVRVRNAAGVSREQSVSITSAAPKLFTWTMDGRGQSIALHADWSTVVSGNPLRPGDWAIVWLTGLGAVNPPLEAGRPGGDNGQYGPLNDVAAAVSISIGGKTVTPAFKGAAPGFAGLYQINFQVPADTPAGLQPFIVTAGGQSSQGNVTIAVDHPGETVATQTVGRNGGTLSGGGVSLQVPPGAFAGDNTITIIRLLTQPADVGARATDTFRINGLPTGYSAPLTLTLPLRAGALPSGDVVVFIAVEGDQSAGEAPKGIPGTVQGGTLTVVLPALPENESSTPATMEPASQTLSLPRAPTAVVQTGSMSTLVWGMAGLKWYTSNSGNFRVWAPDGNYDTVRSLAACLDTAWTRLTTMGLDTSLRKTQIQVFVYSYQSRLASLFMEDTNNAGASESDLWGDQNVGLTLNLDALTGPNGMANACVTSGHELMHVVQALYDPRGRTRKTVSHSPWLWMLEASATWFERAVSADANYLPANLRNNFKDILNTPLEVPPGWWSNNGARAHGYAAVALLQHIDPVSPASGGATVASALRLMAEKNSGYLYDSSMYSPTEALIKVYAGLSNGWSTFARNLAEGKIFSGNTFPAASDWLGWQSVFPALEFGDGDVASQSTNLTMGDLSIHPVLLKFAKWNSPLDDNTPVALTLTDPSGSAGVHLYRVTSTGLEFVQTFTTRYTYQTANQLVQNGSTLLAIVYQKRAQAPFTGTTAVSLEAHIGDDILGLLQSTRNVSFNVSATLMCRQGSTETACAVGGVSKGQLSSTFSGTTFHAEGTVSIDHFTPFSPDYDERDSVPLQYKVEGTVNSTGTKIQSMTIEFKRTADKSSGATTLRRVDELFITLAGIPLSYSTYKTYDQNSTVFQFRAGSNVGAYIAGVSGKLAYGTVLGIIFNETSRITYNRFDVQLGNVIDIRFGK